MTERLRFNKKVNKNMQGIFLRGGIFDPEVSVCSNYKKLVEDFQI